jgi:hypothetical protein
MTEPPDLADVKIELLGIRHSVLAERLILAVCEEIERLRARVIALEEQVESANYERMEIEERL